MARPLRFQYPGAVYHVMARGDGGKVVFETEDDHRVFLARLGEVCGTCGWRVHAWVLMGNHFHLLLETPEGNLITGMKWLLGTFSQGWNRARGRRGHVFQGRYKSVPVNSSDADAYYFRIVADYIHLNPARARLAGGRRGKLAGYRWSSLEAYARGKPPVWLEMDRVLKSFELAENGRGRRAYIAWLEARAGNDNCGIDAEALAALRGGWYLGGETFKDRLLALVDEAKGIKPRKRGGPAGVVGDHGEKEAGRLVGAGLAALGLSSEGSELKGMRKGDERKSLIAALVRKRTAVSTRWIAERLHMGHPGSVSRQLGKVRIDGKLQQKIRRIEKML